MSAISFRYQSAILLVVVSEKFLENLVNMVAVAAVAPCVKRSSVPTQIAKFMGPTCYQGM